MALNIISNYAANVAQRYLQRSDEAATRSVAKLSAGTRVLTARDDAAAMAVGTKLRSDVNGLAIAAVNVGQAASMVQIADGALGTVSDVLVRMKTLATQSNSGQLTSTERGMMQAEFGQLKLELDRTAASTTFNGTKLIAANSPQTAAVLDVADNTDYLFNNADNGIVNLDVSKAAEGHVFGLNYDAESLSFTLYNLSTGQAETIGASDRTIAADEPLEKVTFSKLGVSFEIDDNFDKTADLDYVNAGSNPELPNNGLFRPINYIADADQANAPGDSDVNRLKISDYQFKALKDFDKMVETFDGVAITVNSVLDNANGSKVAIGLKAIADGAMSGLTNGDFSAFDTAVGLDITIVNKDGQVVPLTLQTDDQGNDLYPHQNLNNGDRVIFVAHNDSFDNDREEYFRVEFTIDDVGGLNTVNEDDEEIVAAFGMDVNSLFAVNRVSGKNGFDFQIGATSSTNDRLRVDMDIVTTTSLGLENAGVRNTYESQQSLISLESAIASVATSRSMLGASANRLDFAAQNLSTMKENLEAARSNLLDLDVAAEMSFFTSQQILQQAGVSMLAQANQMPQNLLRLFR